MAQSAEIIDGRKFWKRADWEIYTKDGEFMGSLKEPTLAVRLAITMGAGSYVLYKNPDVSFEITQGDYDYLEARADDEDAFLSFIALQADKLSAQAEKLAKQ